MNISETDLLGRFFFRCKDTEKVHGYFACVNRLTKLFLDEGFKNRVSGFYFNISDGFNSVRLSYFSSDPQEIESIVTEYLQENPDLHIYKKTNPKEVRFSNDYGGTEIGFRNFLHNYSQISLDLLDFDLQYSRNLVAKYRFEYSITRKPSHPLFEPAFKKHSDYYNSLSCEEKEQVFRDLDFWHQGGDWAHMMVNALLPGDQHPTLIKYPTYFRMFMDEIDLEYDEKWEP